MKATKITAAAILVLFFGVWGAAYLAGGTPTQAHREMIQSIIDRGIPDAAIEVDQVALPLMHRTPAVWPLQLVGMGPASQVESYFTIKGKCEVKAFSFTARYTGDGQIRVSVNESPDRLRQCI